VFKCGGSAGALTVSNITVDSLGCNLKAELSTYNACGVNLNVSTQSLPCISDSSSSSSTAPVLNSVASVDSMSVANARISGPQSLQSVATDAKMWTSATSNLVSSQGPLPTLPPTLAAFTGLEFNVAVMPNANGSSLLSASAINGLPTGASSINADGTVALSFSLPPFGRAQLLNVNGSLLSGGNFGSFVSWIVSGPRYSGQVFAGGDICPGSNVTRAAYITYVCDSSSTYRIPSQNITGSILSASMDANMCVLTATVGTPDFCGVDLTVGRESATRSPSPSPLTGPSAFISSYFGTASSSLVGLLFQLPSTGASYNLTVMPFSKAFLTDPFSGSTMSLGSFQNWTFVGQNLTFSGSSGSTNSNPPSGLNSLQYSGHAFTSGDLCPGSTTRRRGLFVSYVCGGYSIETGQTRGVVESASTDSTGCGMMVSVAIPEACGVNFTLGEERSLPSASPSPVGGPRNIVTELRNDPLIIGNVVKALNGNVMSSQAVVLKHFDIVTLLVPLNPANPSNSHFNIVNQGQFAGWVTAPDPTFVGSGAAPLVYIGQRYTNGDACSPNVKGGRVLNRSAFVKLTCGSTKKVTETIYNDAVGCSVNVTYTNPDLCGVNAALGAELASSSPSPSVTPTSTGTPSTTNTAPRSVTPSPSKSVSALPPGASPSPSPSPRVAGSEVSFNMTVPGCATRSQVRSSGLEGALLDSVSSAADLDPSTVVLKDAQCQVVGGGTNVEPSMTLSFIVSVDPPANAGFQAGSAAGDSVGGVNLGGAASGRDVVLANSILISQKLKSGLSSSNGKTLVMDAMVGVSSKWGDITGANLTSRNVTISDVVVDVSSMQTSPLIGGNSARPADDTSDAYTAREVVGATFASLSSILLAILGRMHFFKSNNKSIVSGADDSDEVITLQKDNDMPHPARHSNSPHPARPQPHDLSRKETFEPTPFSSSSSAQAEPALFTGANPMWSPPDPYENDKMQIPNPKKGGRNKKSSGMSQEEYVSHY